MAFILPAPTGYTVPSNINTLANKYLQNHPKCDALTIEQKVAFSDEFWKKAYKVWDRKSEVRPPNFDSKRPGLTVVNVGVFSRDHPNPDMHGKKAGLAIMNFDPQRYRISWAWLDEDANLHEDGYVQFNTGMDLEKAREVAALAYDKAEEEAVRKHNNKVLVAMARRQVLMGNGKLEAKAEAVPLVTPIYVSMLVQGQSFTTHFTALLHSQPVSPSQKRVWSGGVGPWDSSQAQDEDSAL
ncbi:hypothetical protein ACHAPT_000541 [Fusarium lateritium]